MADEDQIRMFLHCLYSMDYRHLLFRIFHVRWVFNYNSRDNITQLLYGSLLYLKLNGFGL